MKKTKFEQWLEIGIVLAYNEEVNQQDFPDFISYLPPSKTEVFQEIFGIFSDPQQELKKVLVTQGTKEFKLALEVIEIIIEDEKNDRDKKDFLSKDFSDYLILKLLGAKQLISCDIEQIKKIMGTSIIVIYLVILLSFLLFLIYSSSWNHAQDYSLVFYPTLGGMIGGILFWFRTVWLKSRSLLIYQKLMRILDLSFSLSKQQKICLTRDDSNNEIS